jgi:Ca2+-binding EF-hand superfamily protein
MSVSGVGGGYNPYAAQQFQQNLFSQIDTNGDGSVSKTELEQAVSKAGGTARAADALYSVLDPGNSGGFSEQQFAQALPGPVLSNQVQAQMIGYQAQGWPGASQPGGQLAQSLFSQIDSNGDGSISKAELEQAVTAAGGTKAGADALYAKLDPNNTGGVSEQQFAQSLSQTAPHGHHHHHHGGGGDAASATDGGSATDALTSLFNADSGGAGNSPTQIAQNIFSQIDSNGDGTITQSELEQAVTAAGGSSKAGADALYAKLDPNGTGSVSEQQFISALQPPSAGGNTAQDALLALLDQVTQSNATPPVGGVGSTTGGATSSISTGTTAQDALAELVQNFDPATATSTGSSAQDAISALLNPSNGTSNGAAGTSTAPAFNSTDFAHALSLYQSQLEQQLLAGISATQSASI